jgi:hypothetical protein
MAGKTFSQKVQEWRFVVDQTRPLLTQVPHIAEEHAKLEALVQRVEALFKRAEDGRAAQMASNQLRREATTDGTESRARIASALLAHFGTKNEELIAFGVNPRPRTFKKTPKSVGELAAVNRELEELREELEKAREEGAG